MTDNPQPVHIGWYCWRCQGLVEQACRSDNVPVSVPAEWADGMRAEIRRHGDEDDEPPGPAATEATGHVYLSTGCYHDDHAYCQGMTGLNGAKRPAQCKKCGARCICPCHQQAAVEPVTRLHRLRDQLAAEHGKAVAADQAAAQRPDRADRLVSPHDGIAAGLEIAVSLVEHHLREAGESAHDGGPSVKEAAADDRVWPLQKAGE